MGHAEEPGDSNGRRPAAALAVKQPLIKFVRANQMAERGKSAHGYTHTGGGGPLLFLRDTWKGVEMQRPYGELLREVNKEINYWKTQKGTKSVMLECDAQVEFQPNHEPLTGSGLRGGKTKNIQHNKLEMQLEAENFKLMQQQRLKLVNTHMDWTPTHSPTS